MQVLAVYYVFSVLVPGSMTAYWVCTKKTTTTTSNALECSLLLSKLLSVVLMQMTVFAPSTVATVTNTKNHQSRQYWS